MDAKARLDREFLEMRCRLIDLAASLDRIERGEGLAKTAGDLRLAHIRRALAIVADVRPNRVEQVQMLFSDPYGPDWRKELGM